MTITMQMVIKLVGLIINQGDRAKKYAYQWKKCNPTTVG